MLDEVKLLPCDLDDATAEQIERANEAVGYNMNEDGTPKWQSAQGYACALAAIMLSDSSASRICNALAEFATFADDFPQDAPNTTSVQGTLGMCRRAKALLATRPPIGTDEVVARMPLRERIGVALMEINVRPTDRRQVGFSRDELLAAADAAIAVLYPSRAAITAMKDAASD